MLSASSWVPLANHPKRDPAWLETRGVGSLLSLPIPINIGQETHLGTNVNWGPCGHHEGGGYVQRFPVIQLSGLLVGQGFGKEPAFAAW